MNALGDWIKKEICESGLVVTWSSCERYSDGSD